jgi:hypothetical protein
MTIRYFFMGDVFKMIYKIAIIFSAVDLHTSIIYFIDIIVTENYGRALSFFYLYFCIISGF